MLIAVTILQFSKGQFLEVSERQNLMVKSPPMCWNRALSVAAVCRFVCPFVCRQHRSGFLAMVASWCCGRPSNAVWHHNDLMLGTGLIVLAHWVDTRVWWIICSALQPDIIPVIMLTVVIITETLLACMM